MKYYLSILFGLIDLISFAQITDKSLEYYNAANQAVSQRQYILADSLYTKSLELNRHPDTYYNRAMVRKKNNDLSGYCSDLGSAASLGDTISNQEFWINCGKIDTSYFDDKNILSNKNNYNHFEITKKCIYTQNIRFQKIDRDKNFLLNYNVIDNDTLFESGTELKLPSFPGGETELIKYIQSKLVYPKLEKELGIKGTVYTTFVVGKNGEIKKPSILRGIKGGKDLGEEAIKFISTMPKWTPGSYNGRPVEVRFVLPIKYTLK